MDKGLCYKHARKSAKQKRCKTICKKKAATTQNYPKRIKNMLPTESSKMIMDYKSEEASEKKLSPESNKIPNNKEQVQLTEEKN